MTGIYMVTSVVFLRWFDYNNRFQGIFDEFELHLSMKGNQPNKQSDGEKSWDLFLYKIVTIVTS